VLLWAADEWLLAALAPRLAVVGRRLAVVSPCFEDERGSSGEDLWEIPAPAGAEIDAALARVFAGLGSCSTAIVEIRLVDGGGEVGDWESGVGQRLYRSFAAARAAARHMAERNGGEILLLAVDRDGETPWPEADVCRAAARTMAHGLAKAAVRGVRVGAVVSGPIEESRPSGQRGRYLLAATQVADAVAWLLEGSGWASGSVVHLDRD